MPVRVELGPKDLAKNACVLARRDLPGKEAQGDGRAAGRGARIASSSMLETMQTDLFERARKFRDANSFEVNSYDEFKQKIEEPGGFLLGPLGRHARDGGPHRRRDQGDDPLHPVRPARRKTGKCMVTGKPSEGRVVFAKAY